MDPFFESSPSRAYFDRLERWFIELRGAPMQLSPDDYRVARAWFEAGIPLELVRSEIGEIVERRRREEAEVKRRLRYYDRAVTRAFEERRRLQAPGDSAPEPTLDLARRLERLACALPSASWSRGAADTVRGLEGPAEAVEEALQALEEELLAKASAAFDDPERGRFEAAVAQARARLADTLPGGDLATAGERLERQILRRFVALPELSLFGVVAAGVDEEPAGGEGGIA